MNLRTYVTWCELHGGVPSSAQEFRERLTRYSRSSVVYICAVINNLLRTWDLNALDPKSQRLFIDAAFPADVARPLVEMVAHPNNERAVFFRTQLMYVAKQACIAPRILLTHSVSLFGVDSESYS